MQQREYLREELYQKLIKPILSYINGVKRLYIAPDRELLNLPFELLYSKSDVQWKKYYDIDRIECARDLLFRTANDRRVAGSLVMGDPQFAIRNYGKAIIPALPYSRLEAQAVSSYCGCRCYSGLEASKTRFLSASGCGYRNIHIATHGYLDTSGKAEAMYSASVQFAGAEDWWRTGTMDKDYGNGIVTADEVSRMDLRGVELVVLSTCWSGMNVILEDKGFHGMLGAFSAAGVQHVISHLWSADDLATTILMTYFYYYYMNQNWTPPAALNAAKQDLQKTTVRQLKADGWFDFLLRGSPESTARKFVQKCASHSERECLFEDEKYWGGFACYRCN